MNLIYIFADQWRRDTVGFNNKEVITPNIDGFASKSAAFNRAYSLCPVCSPHRACLLTGRYTRSNGVFTNCKTGLDVELNESEICVSDVLKENGYKTGYIGKWHLDKPDGSGGWDAYTSNGKRRHGFDFWYSYGACDEHTAPHYWNSDGERIEVNKWSPDHETDIALDFLESTEDNFALFISYNPPHSPYDRAPQKYKDLYKNIDIKYSDNLTDLYHHTGEPDKNKAEDLAEITRDYYGAVSGLDYNIGRILDYIKSKNIYNDTLIVISSDHGDMLGSHGLMGKYVWYEESVGIPLIIGGAGIHSMKTNELIGSVDHAPTVLGMLGVDIPQSMEGKDFSPLIRGNSFEGYNSIMTAGFPNSVERIKEFEKHGENPLDYGWRSIIIQDYKLAVHKGYSYGEEERRFLYDLKNDPYEKFPVNDEQKIGELMGELKKWCKVTNDGFAK